MFHTGLTALDGALTDNGFLPGSIVEISGTPDSCKSALALWCCRTAQHADHDLFAGWVSTEAPLTAVNAIWAGIDPYRMVVARQETGYAGLDLATDLVQAGCQVVVVDSIAGIQGETADGLYYQVLSRGLSRLSAALIQTGAVAILTNQERQIIGGNSTRHAASCRALTRLVDVHIRLKTGAGLYRGGVKRGMRVQFTLVKNGPDPAEWGRSGRFLCYWDRGLVDAPRPHVE